MKCIAAARGECTAKRSAKQENKASYNTDYNVPSLTGFFGDDCKKIKRQTEKKEIFIFVKNIVLTKNWFIVRNFSEFPKDNTEKIMFWLSVFPTKNKS